MRNRIFLVALIAIVAFAAPTASRAVCVHDVTEFQQALDNAVGTTPTSIQVARGTYPVGTNSLKFTSTTAGQGQLDISGGYSSDCSTQIPNAERTVLDGLHQGLDGAFGVLSLSSTGGISVRYLTIQNGAASNATNNNPGGLYVQGTGPVVANNIIRGNTSQLSYSGVVVIVNGASDASNIHVDNNLIVGNATYAYSSAVGAAWVTHKGTGRIYITNNTISENTGEFQTGLSVSGELVTLSNNVIYVPDENCYPGFGCDFIGSALLMNNDIGSMAGNVDPMSSGNVAVNPLFASSNDFHLSSASPLLGQGLIAPAGGLPSFDIAGQARSYNGSVDMGAYERGGGNDIFADGFDD